MPITLSVSTLAQSRTQSKRLTDLGRELDNLQRQVTTGKKYDSYTEFGTQAYTLQNIKTQTPKIEAYIDNIDKAGTDMEQMTRLMEKVSEVANNVKEAVNLRESDTAGIESLAEFAQANLDFLKDILNEKGLDGNYLFAGGNLSEQVFVNDSSLNTNYSNEVTAWLNGTNTTNQLTANSDAFNSTTLGFSTALDTATGRNTQIDDNLTVDYSIKGNIEGIQNIIRAVALVANMEYPGPADVATEDEVDTIFQYASSTLSAGVIQTNDEVQNLSSKFSFINSIKENHQNDLEVYLKQTDTIENVNPSEALLQMQLLRTQLETSYQVTSIVSELSLVNFIR